MPSERPEALGGVRKSRRCASNVVALVGWIVTLEVESLYGTNIIREPSLFRSPEFLRNNRLPCSFSACRFFHHLLLPVPPAMIERASSRVATTFVKFEVPFALDRNRFEYLR